MSFAKVFRLEPGDELLSTAMVSDSLDAIGLRNQVLPKRLAPLVPGSRMIGSAKTVQFAPSLAVNPDDPYGDAIDFISAVVAGQVVVISTGVSNDSAFWGELFSAAALGAGAVGVVTDGNLRDTDKIARLGFPAFSPGRRPIDFRARMRIVEHDAPVTLYGVHVAPGDLILADDDGVVVVPAEREEEVLDIARQRASSESTVLAELLAGATLRDVWDRHKVL
jgi:regulator of RNase E activity RraA